MKFLPMNSYSSSNLTQVKHCHIFFTDVNGSGKLDYIFFDIKKSIVSFVDLSCQFIGLPADADRIKIESDMYNFVLHPSHLNKSVIREGNKIILGFKVCYECNMASLN